MCGPLRAERLDHMHDTSHNAAGRWPHGPLGAWSLGAGCSPAALMKRKCSGLVLPSPLAAYASDEKLSTLTDWQSACRRVHAHQ
jgi:hypothetical protein